MYKLSENVSKDLTTIYSEDLVALFILRFTVAKYYTAIFTTRCDVGSTFLICHLDS